MFCQVSATLRDSAPPHTPHPPAAVLQDKDRLEGALAGLTTQVARRDEEVRALQLSVAQLGAALEERTVALEAAQVGGRAALGVLGGPGRGQEGGMHTAALGPT